MYANSDFQYKYLVQNFSILHSGFVHAFIFIFYNGCKLYDAAGLLLGYGILCVVYVLPLLRPKAVLVDTGHRQTGDILTDCVDVTGQ